MENNNQSEKAIGEVISAFGNLISVKFQGNIRLGEVAFLEVGEQRLKSEVIELCGDYAKIQVFEDTTGIECGTKVHFSGNLLEAVLGPGLLGTIFDGLQNRLEDLFQLGGHFLPRGVYVDPINKTNKWNFNPIVKIGDKLTKGGVLGSVQEYSLTHKIMVPFSIEGEVEVTWISGNKQYTVDEVIAKVVDERGNEHSLNMLQRWPIKDPISLGKRLPPSEQMTVGLRILDTMMPILKGGTLCTPGPFGAGKTVLQHHLSKYADVDIVILCACGERAGEVVEVLKEFPKLHDPKNGKSLMERTCVICNTSSMPVAARESSVYMAITLAEYYRQMGLDVLLLADSTSRWAQAMREMSGRLEEIPGEEAFPVYLASRIASFYERGGVLSLKDGTQGSVTICGTVSPAGGNFEEPVTQATLSVVGAFCGLSRERSDARKYPAIDPLISWSKYIEKVANSLEGAIEGWGQIVKSAYSVLKSGEEVGRRVAVVGEEGISMDDMVTFLKSELFDFCFLQQNAFDEIDSYCCFERQLEIMGIMSLIFERQYNFYTKDEAREYFISLQNKIKNMNVVQYKTEEYSALYNEVKESVIEEKNKVAK